jgi:hypothetical protein
LVSAWRAATWAFKRFVDTAASTVAEPEKAAPPPVELNALSLLDSLERDAELLSGAGRSQRGWLEFDDADLIEEESEPPGAQNAAAEEERESSDAEDGAEASRMSTGKKKLKSTTDARGKAKASRKTLRNEARRKGTRSKATKR